MRSFYTDLVADDALASRLSELWNEGRGVYSVVFAGSVDGIISFVIISFTDTEAPSAR